MSAVLKVVKKLEQDPIGVDPAADLSQRETDPEKASGRGTRSLRPRAIAFYVLFVPLLAIGGWLLLKDGTTPAEKYQPGKPMRQAIGAIPTNRSAAVAPVSQETDLKPKVNRSQTSPISARQERAAARKTVVASRTGVRVLERNERKLPAIVTRTQPRRELKRPGRELGADSRSVQTGRAPISTSRSPSRGELTLLSRDSASPRPRIGSYPPGTVGKAAAGQSSLVIDISVQAIAWSKNPLERIAVINGLIVREGDFLSGIQVAEIGLDEVHMKKGDKTWPVRFGR